MTVEQQGRNDVTDEAVEQASYALFRLGRKFSKFPQHQYLDVEQGRGLELSHILVVQAVQARQAMTQEATIGSIAAEMELDPSTASRLVAVTQRAGYVTRKASTADGRVAQVELTAAGEKLAAAAQDFQRQTFEAIMGAWSADERATFIPLFVKFVEDVINALAVDQAHITGRE